MTVTATRMRAAGQQSPRAAREDRLVPFPEAARRLGRSPDTLRLWHDDGHMPAVVTPGGQWCAYESFIDAVLASARPKQAGSIEQIARDWFEEHSSEAVA